MRQQSPRARTLFGLGALGIATTMAAAGPAAAQDTSTGPTAEVRDARLDYGERVVVSGRTPAGPGAAVRLEFLPAGQSAWLPVARASAGDTGRFRLAGRLSRSGAVRVVAAPAAPAASAATAAPAGPGGEVASPVRRVRVAAHLTTDRERLAVRVGRPALVTGAVRHPVAGRGVVLQRRSGGGWATVARDRTDARGAFRLRFTPQAAERAALRVRVAGDATNATARRSVGVLTAFRPAVASWYGPGFYGSTTACGQTFHAGLMGVAHKSLPCGTKVTLRHGSRTVQARVVDRGPFIAGREFDLGVAVKEALGFGSGGTVEVAH
jgi:hypothetical protein